MHGGNWSGLRSRRANPSRGAREAHVHNILDSIGTPITLSGCATAGAYSHHPDTSPIPLVVVTMNPQNFRPCRGNEGRNLGEKYRKLGRHAIEQRVLREPDPVVKETSCCLQQLSIQCTDYTTPESASLETCKARPLGISPRIPHQDDYSVTHRSARSPCAGFRRPTPSSSA